MDKKVIDGLELRDEFKESALPPDIRNELYGSTKIRFYGTNTKIPITERMLSQHILFTGGIGTGKTNAMNQVVDQLIKGMTPNDVMVIFDSKGDFLEEFRDKTKNPAVISNDDNANVYWNMINEALIDEDKYGERYIEENLMELATSIFGPTIDKSKTDPFFPLAAKNIFYSILYYMYTKYGAFQKNNKTYINNEKISMMSKLTTEELVAKFISGRCEKNLRQMVEFLGQMGPDNTFETSKQGDSVIATMRNVLIDIFKGNFARSGDFSIRSFVRSKGARVLFIEYDLSQGRVLAPIYKTMLDMAIKEALCRDRSKGNVYFIFDEFRLLPRLDYMDSGVNLGRSLGAKFIVAMQNLEQVVSVYDESEAMSILSGFVTSVNFRTSDKQTRDYIKGQFGECYISYDVISSAGGKTIEKSEVIQDSDILRLGRGQSIISVPALDKNPIRFQFKEYSRYLM